MMLRVDLVPDGGATHRRRAAGFLDVSETDWRPRKCQKHHPAVCNVLNLDAHAVQASEPDSFSAAHFAIAQQLTRIGTTRLTAAKVFTEAARFQLHISATLITFDDRAIVAFNPELPLSTS